MQSAFFRRMRISSPGQTWCHLTENRILSPTAHGKPHSVPDTPPSSHAKAHSTCVPVQKTHSVRKQSRRVRLSVRHCSQNALFRTARVAECAFPYGTGCRMRFSVECAFPYLGKRRAISRKTAFCVRCLTEKRILSPLLHGKAHSASVISRKNAFCIRRSERLHVPTATIWHKQWQRQSIAPR